MLLNPEHNISEVAYRLGYADAPHLSRIFKRFRGMSPREYRKTYVTDPHRDRELSNTRETT
jgi:AraC-like DNA-binding protein